MGDALTPWFPMILVALILLPLWALGRDKEGVRLLLFFLGVGVVFLFMEWIICLQ